MNVILSSVVAQVLFTYKGMNCRIFIGILLIDINELTLQLSLAQKSHTAEMIKNTEEQHTYTTTSKAIPWFIHPRPTSSTTSIASASAFPPPTHIPSTHSTHTNSPHLHCIIYSILLYSPPGRRTKGSPPNNRRCGGAKHPLFLFLSLLRQISAELKVTS